MTAANMRRSARAPRLAVTAGVALLVSAGCRPEPLPQDTADPPPASTPAPAEPMRPAEPEPLPPVEPGPPAGPATVTVPASTAVIGGDPRAVSEPFTVDTR